MARDYVLDQSDLSRTLIYRHCAWLTALRFQLRETREWENTNRPHFREYRKIYRIPEWETTLE